MYNLKHVVISCAGMGTRLGLDIPKCLVKVNKKTLLEHMLDNLKDVDNVYIIVGFKEELVTEIALKYRPDAIIVRNSFFKSTSNVYSIELIAKYFKEPFACIDGDLLIPKESLASFFSSIKPGQPLVGICKAKTEDAVYVHTNSNGLVTKFCREDRSMYEWCGVAYIADISIDSSAHKYLYEVFVSYLPLHTHLIDQCYEVDTPADLHEMKLAFN